MNENHHTILIRIINSVRLIHLPQASPTIQYQATLLQIIIYVNLLVSSMLIVYGIFGDVSYKLAGTLITLLVIALHLRALHIIRQGKVKQAGRIVIYVSWTTISLTIFNSGGLYSSGMMGLMTLLVIAVLVLEVRDRFIVYAMTLVYCVFLYVIETTGNLPDAPFKELPLRITVLFLVATTIYTVIQYHLYAIKKSELEITKLQIDAERQRVQRDLTQNLTHDLKTPLSILQTSAYLIRKGYENNLPLEDYIAKLEKEVQRVNNMIGDLFLLDTISGDSKKTMQRIDLEHVLNVCIENARPFAWSRDIDITFEKQISGKSCVLGHQSQLINVFNKLLINAVHYGQDGGFIKVRLYEDAPDLLVDVSDNGIGIASEHHEKIFERFYRVDAARTHREKQGAGVGLNAVQRIVQYHNGDIHLLSNAGEGSTFTVKIPMLEEQGFDIRPRS